MKLLNTRFTPKQWEILMDRPDDCIVDTLIQMDFENDRFSFSHQSIEDAIEDIRAGRWVDDAVHIEALEDMVSGSTAWAGTCDDSQQQQDGTARAGITAAEKVSALIGRTVEFPLY